MIGGHTMRGFDAEFHSLDQYIRVITARIWEGRRIDDIYTYYSDPCVVETPSSVSTAVQAVVDGTRATLAQFPDRRLLAEDIIWSGDDAIGFMSSHRIISPMTHAGDGAFGPATGQPVQVRTIADCWCYENKIQHEWLVRDQSAIAHTIGVAPAALAHAWLGRTDGRFVKPTPPAPPMKYAPEHSNQPTAQMWAGSMRSRLTNKTSDWPNALYDEAVHAVLPGETHIYGWQRLVNWWGAFQECFDVHAFDIEHLIAQPTHSGPLRLAVRWRAQCTHVGGERFGTASGRPVEVMAIAHAEVRDGKIVREWMLIDEIALWMQVLSK
jgi:predicted ester cyclase